MQDFDIIIIGAGLSGIGAAYHVQDKCPTLTYAILESRANIGGTWELFRYPGIRSDSDMYTLGYSFYPWKDAKAIADGPSILRYIHETSEAFGIGRHIRLNHRVTAASWNSNEARWSLTMEKTETGEKLTMRARFVILCCGYYDYEEGYTPEYPGLEKFRGEFVHPQKWNEQIKYADRKVVVIGSGATAVTLVPELAKKAARVTMLQRSPTYITPLPSIDRTAEFIKKYLPARLAHHLIRWKNILLGQLFFRYCRNFPNHARKLLMKYVRRSLRGHGDIRDFTPRYNPWDQRICLASDGDLFKAVRRGKAEIVTDTIESFTEEGIRLKSGKMLPADLVVTATGLKLKFLGGIPISVDGKAIRLVDTLPYKGAMLSGIPNLGMAFGYTNASWTLKCDLICDWLARLISFMDKNRYSTATPQKDPDVQTVPLIDFSSGYFQRAKDLLPRQGTESPWKLNQNYFADLMAFRIRRIKDKGLRFS